MHYDVDDIPVGTRGILCNHLAAACAHGLNLTQLEWGNITTFLTELSQPRRTSKEKSSNLGEPRASGHYGHNTDVDKTVLDALVTQYMLTDSSPEVILITEQVNADGLSVKVEEQKVAEKKLYPLSNTQLCSRQSLKSLMTPLPQARLRTLRYPTIANRYRSKVKRRADGRRRL